MFKVCPHCKQDKEVENYYKNKLMRDGLSCWCKICESARLKEYVSRNKEAVKETAEKWKRVFIESNGWKGFYEKYGKKYKQSKKGKICSRGYAKRYGQKLKAYARSYYYSEDGRKVRLEYYNQNYDRIKLAGAKRRALKRNAKIDNSITKKSLLNLLYTQDYKCNMCFLDLRIMGKHLDHIMPLSKGGSHALENVQYLCPTCNCSKQDKILPNQLQKCS